MDYNTAADWDDYSWCKTVQYAICCMDNFPCLKQINKFIIMTGSIVLRYRENSFIMNP